MAPSSDAAGSAPAADATSRTAAAPAMGHQACERCWKRKQKCDRQLPSCSTCAGLGVPCQARSVQFDLLTDDSPLSHASTLSYVQTLKRRLADRQHTPQSSPTKRVRRAMRPERDGVPAGTVSALSSPPLQPGSFSATRIRTAASEAGTSSTRGTMRTGGGAAAAAAAATAAAMPVSADAQADAPNAPDATDGSIRAMMGEIGFLSRSAIGEPRDDEPTTAVQRPQRLAPDRVVMAALALDGHDPSGSRRDVGAGLSLSLSLAAAGLGHLGHHEAKAVEAAAASRSTTLLSPDGPDDVGLLLHRHAAAAHLRRFLDEVAVRFPHLATAKAADQLKGQFEAVLSGARATTTTTTTSTATTATSTATTATTLPPLARFSVYLAVATGALLAPDAARLRASAQRLHAAAVRLLPAVLAHRPGTTGAEEALGAIRAIVGLVVYATLEPDGGSAWHLLGMATKRCIVLGLRREPDVPSVAEADERRRLFWSVYLLDRSIGLVMDRPFSIQDEDISVSMPEDDATSRETPPFFSLSHHLVVQARLVSAVRTAARSAPLFDYSNFCYWRDFPPPLDHLPADARDAHADYLHLLACRTLVQITANCLQAGEPATTTTSTPLPTTATSTATTMTTTAATTSAAESASAAAAAAVGSSPPSSSSSFTSSSSSSASTSVSLSPKERDHGSQTAPASRDNTPVEGASFAAAAAAATADVNVGLLSGHSLLQSIDDDAARHCRGVIERAYARADRELFVGSFVDAYDLFAAGVVYLCLASRRHRRSRGRSHGRHRHHHHHHHHQSLLETTDLLNKCTMLITSIGERFSALKPLRRVLVALLARLRARKMAYSNVPELDTLPAIVPTYLKQMIHKWL